MTTLVHEPPDPTGYSYRVVVNGRDAIDDLRAYVPFCAGLPRNEFASFSEAVSAAQGLRNALDVSAIVAIEIYHQEGR